MPVLLKERIESLAAVFDGGGSGGGSLGTGLGKERGQQKCGKGQGGETDLHQGASPWSEIKG